MTAPVVASLDAARRRRQARAVLDADPPPLAVRDAEVAVVGAAEALRQAPPAVRADPAVAAVLDALEQLDALFVGGPG